MTRAGALRLEILQKLSFSRRSEIGWTEHAERAAARVNELFDQCVE